MALYAIGDLHLSFGADKPMDVFGGAWTGYVDKLREGLSVIGPDDTTVLAGDLSWGMDFDQAREDFQFIAQIPGRKILLKGNHDYWWNTAAKFGFENLFLLNNNAYEYDDYALCGTRGWFYEEERQGTHDEKVFRRELLRLEASLKAAEREKKLCFLHYPPLYQNYRCPEILQLLHQFGVERCYYGHLHGASHKLAIEGNREGIEYFLVSADYVNFSPVKVLP